MVKGIKSITNRAAALAAMLLVLPYSGPGAADGASMVKEITYPSYIGRVLQVVTGDALQMVLVDGRRVDVRLAGLQAPAEGEPFAESSRLWLQRQVAGEIVSIDCDPRSVDSPSLRCVVYPDERDINSLALRSGTARPLQADLQSAELGEILNAERYQSAASIARNEKSGVWAESTLSAAVSP